MVSITAATSLNGIRVNTFDGRAAWCDGQRLLGDKDIVRAAYAAIINGSIIPVSGEHYAAGLSPEGVAAALHAWDPASTIMVQGPSMPTSCGELTLEMSDADFAVSPG
ncbi:hypothetical protein [Nesterenkonia rhizosphaerae]|uniref:Uncharacterized protein n=1 Tax=Nesterenkonia rhizosphaerae TaxID=1348272 RepID=A0ABP9G0B6_9MICC